MFKSFNELENEEANDKIFEPVTKDGQHVRGFSTRIALFLNLVI